MQSLTRNQGFMAHLINLICLSIYPLLRIRSLSQWQISWYHVMDRQICYWLRERMRERILSNFSKSDWLRQITWQMGADAGADSREWILSHVICLIGSDRSHYLVSAPASAPASAPESDWIGRSVTANDKRGESAPASAPENQQISNFWQQ